MQLLLCTVLYYHALYYYYAGSISYCTHTVLILYSYCTPTLYSYCTHTVLTHCTHTLHSHTVLTIGWVTPLDLSLNLHEELEEGSKVKRELDDEEVQYSMYYSCTTYTVLTMHSLYTLIVHSLCTHYIHSYCTHMHCTHIHCTHTLHCTHTILLLY
jgi:hypothetical protein